MRRLRRAEVGCPRLKQTAGEADLAPGGLGLGSMLDRAMVLRCSASVFLAFFGVRRASEIAGLRMADIKVGEAGGLAEVKVRPPKHDQVAR